MRWPARRHQAHQERRHRVDQCRRAVRGHTRRSESGAHQPDAARALRCAQQVCRRVRRRPIEAPAVLDTGEPAGAAAV